VTDLPTPAEIRRARKADLVAWCGVTGHTFVGLGKANGYTRYFIRKEILQ